MSNSLILTHQPDQCSFDQSDLVQLIHGSRDVILAKSNILLSPNARACLALTILKSILLKLNWKIFSGECVDFLNATKNDKSIDIKIIDAHNAAHLTGMNMHRPSDVGCTDVVYVIRPFNKETGAPAIIDIPRRPPINFEIVILRQLIFLLESFGIKLIEESDTVKNIGVDKFGVLPYLAEVKLIE